MDKIRGAYGEVRFEDFIAGDPRPDMPETLCLLLEDVDKFGRFGGRGGGMLPTYCRLEAELDLVSIGGVFPPEFNVDVDFVVGTELWVPLLESVLRSVLKLALDRRRMSLRNEGAIGMSWGCCPVYPSCDVVYYGIFPKTSRCSDSQQIQSS
jgi:hypothetical protein